MDNPPQYVTVCGPRWAEVMGTVYLAHPLPHCAQKVQSFCSWGRRVGQEGSGLDVSSLQPSLPDSEREHDLGGNRGPASRSGMQQPLSLRAGCLGASPCGPRCRQRAPQQFTETNYYSCHKNKLN